MHAGRQTWSIRWQGPSRRVRTLLCIAEECGGRWHSHDHVFTWPPAFLAGEAFGSLYAATLKPCGVQPLGLAEESITERMLYKGPHSKPIVIAAVLYSRN